jgi:hypothetical protein
MKTLAWFLILLIAVPSVWAGHCGDMSSAGGGAEIVMADSSDHGSGHDCCPDESSDRDSVEPRDSECKSRCSSCFFAPTALPVQVPLLIFAPQAKRVPGIGSQLFASPVSRLLRPPIA